ncbi:hypothetical protein MSEO_35240 [Mycobacterium seoulense]|uniref:Uncharacterized protein n=1 Tax=Mycobacterium seoulense TaxID=386911 RepID=A0A7I7P2Q1_9MYCO|nr:hypothetical protein MSEO_35240 [Mycobacterium seoulense]
MTPGAGADGGESHADSVAAASPAAAKAINLRENLGAFVAAGMTGTLAARDPPMLRAGRGSSPAEHRRLE